MATTTFWTITYHDQPCEDDDTMKSASLTWDCDNTEYDTLLQKDLNEYHHFRPVALSWLEELLAHVGDDHYIYNIRQKWDGEFLIFYREKHFKTEHEEKTEKQLKEHYAKYTNDDEAEMAYLQSFYTDTQTTVAPRRMEQSIFRTIVEMANEMGYHEKRNENMDEIHRKVQAIHPLLHTHLNTNRLRSLHAKPTKGHDLFTAPFQWKNHEFRIAVYMEYKRYEEEGRVREKGILTLSPQIKTLGDPWREVHHLVWVRKEYMTREEFPAVLAELSSQVVGLFIVYLN